MCNSSAGKKSEKKKKSVEVNLIESTFTARPQDLDPLHDRLKTIIQNRENLESRFCQLINSRLVYHR